MKTVIKLAAICLGPAFLSSCMTTGKEGKLASDAARNEKNIKVEGTRIPLKEQASIEVFVFTDSGEKPTPAPHLRDGYRIRISIDE